MQQYLTEQLFRGDSFLPASDSKIKIFFAAKDAKDVKNAKGILIVILSEAEGS